MSLWSSSCLHTTLWASLVVVAVGIGRPVARAEVLPAQGTLDARVRVAPYSPEQVYTLYGYVGYQIDLEFEAGESFVGLAAGDIVGIGFVAQDNHLFLKPKASQVDTNLTVLTNRRHYQFDYTVFSAHPSGPQPPKMYAVRFTYPPKPDAAAAVTRTDAALAHATTARVRNSDYGFCGNPAVKPIAAYDDGVHTWLEFAPKAELPAIFVRNDDGSESLLNFNMEEGKVVIHRVAHRFVLRRGRLAGCVVNQHFEGGGERLAGHTVSPEVERTTKPVSTETLP